METPESVAGQQVELYPDEVNDPELTKRLLAGQTQRMIEEWLAAHPPE